MLLTPEDVAELLMDAEDVRQKMHDKGVHRRRAETTVPLGTISCGELIRIIRGCTLLILQAYPQLNDPAVVEGLIRSSAAREAGGAVN